MALAYLSQNPMISIHAPRGGSDKAQTQNWQMQVFQSTLPAGGATN